MRYSVTSNQLRIKELGKLNIEHIGNSVHPAEVFVLGKSQNSHINFLMFYRHVLHKQTICEMKAHQVYKF